jgi:multimeric flavodoxin WrbA
MKILIISGSRNPKGQTARAADAFRQGVLNEKNECEILFLPHFEIERCRQCEDTGWGVCRREG